MRNSSNCCLSIHQHLIFSSAAAGFTDLWADLLSLFSRGSFECTCFWQQHQLTSRLFCAFLNHPSLSDSTNVWFLLFASAIKHIKIQSKHTNKHAERMGTKHDGLHPALQPAQPGSVCCNVRFWRYHFANKRKLRSCVCNYSSRWSGIQSVRFVGRDPAVEAALENDSCIVLFLVFLTRPSGVFPSLR